MRNIGATNPAALKPRPVRLNDPPFAEASLQESIGKLAKIR